MISNFSLSHIRSKCRETQAPHRIVGWSRGPQHGPHKNSDSCSSVQGWCSSIIKEQPVVPAATIYLMKMGYSGAILRYVNECYITDIY